MFSTQSAPVLTKSGFPSCFFSLPCFMARSRLPVVQATKHTKDQGTEYTGTATSPTATVSNRTAI
jgi:hypothetical protein